MNKLILLLTLLMIITPLINCTNDSKISYKSGPLPQ